MKKTLSVLLSLMFVLGLAGCGSSSLSDTAAYAVSPSMAKNSYAAAESASYDSGYYYEDYNYAEEAPMEADYSEKASGNTQTTGETFNDSARKLIKYYYMDLETETFDTFIVDFEERINSFNGYIESMNAYNGSIYSGKSSRNASYKVRIPAINADAFLKYVGGACNITNQSLSVEDVTLSYVDLESKKNSYEIEQDRLLAYLEKAENIEEMMSIEDRIADVRYRLESMGSQLRIYDNLVDYSTFNINIAEVVKYTEPAPPEPEKYWDRVARSFTDAVKDVWHSLENFFVGFVGALPGLVLFVVIVGIMVGVVVLIVKGARKKGAKKNQADAEKKMQQAMKTAEEKAEK